MRIVKKFKEQVIGWNTNRLFVTCTDLLARFIDCGTDSCKFKATRQSSLPSIYEVLNNVEYLKLGHFDKVFTEMVTEIQKKNGKLKLTDSIYPGILILLAHSKIEMRDMAYKSLQMTSNLISQGNSDKILPIIQTIFDKITEKECPFNLTSIRSELWSALYVIFTHISPTRY